MLKKINIEIGDKWLTAFELFVIVIVAIIPLFVNLPFRDNIYLTWEGAYRIYKGQMPFVDFGLPMGYAFWLAPALSFKLFGPYLFSFIKIQSAINIISGITFMIICRVFNVNKGILAICTFMYVVSFSFFNYWPWYNHTVIVFEFISIALLLKVIGSKDHDMYVKNIILLIGAAFFSFLSLFTKQDGGAFTLIISLVLLIYASFIDRDWKVLVVYGISYVLVGLIFIIPLLPHEFSYWFNYGQAPHYSRVNLLDLLNVIFGQSSFLKLYLLAIVFIIIQKHFKNPLWYKNRKEGLFALLTLGVIGQASVLQVTSYVPENGNIYFHSFAFFYIISNIQWGFNFRRVYFFSLTIILVGIWWSGVYWKYAGRIFHKVLAPKELATNVVSISSFTQEVNSTNLDKSTWSFSDEKEFEHIKLPLECIDAIEKLKGWRTGLSPDLEPKVLNMSELTPLAEILNYELETDMPLWYHLNVAMFERELVKIENRIANNYYDLVLFETIPYLNNFYPFSTRAVLLKYYDLEFTFQAPREYTTETIDVFFKRDNKVDE